MRYETCRCASTRTDVVINYVRYRYPCNSAALCQRAACAVRTAANLASVYLRDYRKSCPQDAISSFYPVLPSASCCQIFFLCNIGTGPPVSVKQLAVLRTACVSTSTTRCSGKLRNEAKCNVAPLDQRESRRRESRGRDSAAKPRSST